MSEIKLKPCPFCGSENITEGSRMFDFGEDIYIACKECGAKIQIAKEYGWDDLRKRWNRRVGERLSEMITEPINNEPTRNSVVVEAFEELIDEYGENGEFIVNNKHLLADDLLKELKASTEIGRNFEKEINKTIILYFMKFGE